MASEIKVTNYDVLADLMPGGQFSLNDYSKHIGNSRFSVLVDMYREAFAASADGGNREECQTIVDRIVGVTCHKDVTIAIAKGRFLAQKLGEEEWIVLDDENSNELVHQQLSIPLVVEEEDAEADGVPSACFRNMGLSDKKRGRRQSLLRRSASESTMLEDKKKTYRLLQALEINDDDEKAEIQERSAPTQHFSEPVIFSNRVVTIPEGMDVVLASSGRKLTTKGNVVGNNRLEVMLSLQKGRYQQLGPAEQEKVAKDLVKAVCQFWGGRVLIEQGHAYAKLNDEQAVAFMKNLLSPESHAKPVSVPSAVPSAIPSAVPSAVPSASASKPLLSAPPVPEFLRQASREILLSSESSAKPVSVPSAVPPASASKPLLSAPPVPEFLRQASAEILRSNGIAANAQSEAVKSLQERQAKRAIAKNLGRGIIPESFPQP